MPIWASKTCHYAAIMPLCRWNFYWGGGPIRVFWSIFVLWNCLHNSTIVFHVKMWVHSKYYAHATIIHLGSTFMGPTHSAYHFYTYVTGCENHLFCLIITRLKNTGTSRSMLGDIPVLCIFYIYLSSGGIPVPVQLYWKHSMKIGAHCMNMYILYCLGECRYMWSDTVLLAARSTSATAVEL